MPNGNNFFNPISGVFIIDNVWNLNDRDANNNLKQVEQVRVNPLSIIETFDITQKTHRTMGNVKLSLYPIKGMTVDIIGGADIYNLGFSFADKLYLTEINTTLDGDTHFPAFDKKGWKEISRIHHSKDERHAFDFDFVVYQK